MGKNLRFLFTSKCLAISLLTNPSSHGEGLSFLPLNTWLSVTTWGSSQAFFLKVHPSPASSHNATLTPNPSPQILSHLYVGKDSSPPKKKIQIPHKSFPTNSFLYLYFAFYFCFIYITALNNCFAFCPPKLGILPQSGKLIPQHLGRIIEE